MTLRLFLRVASHHFVAAFIGGVVCCLVVWAFKGEFPDSWFISVACAGVLVVLTGLNPPNFDESEKRYVTLLSPIRLVFLAWMTQIVVPAAYDGHLLAMAVFSILTTRDVVMGRFV